MDNTDALAWFGFQTRLGKRKLLTKYFPVYEPGERPSVTDIVYIYNREHLK